MDKKTLQNPISIDDQIDNLISKGLIIEDRDYAKNFLSKVSYFRFIKAYSIGLKPVSGIGFLGAGTIIVVGKNEIKGLTTAAGLWSCACMGLAIGIGFYEGAIISCVFLIGVLTVLHKLDYIQELIQGY